MDSVNLNFFFSIATTYTHRSQAFEGLMELCMSHFRIHMLFMKYVHYSTATQFLGSHFKPTSPAQQDVQHSIHHKPPKPVH